MEELKEVVDVHQLMPNALDKGQIVSQVQKDSSQFKQEWTENDSVGEVRMGIEGSQGHEGIHFVDKQFLVEASRSALLVQGRGSMVDTRKEEDKTPANIDDRRLQQPNGSLHMASGNMESGDDLRVIQPEIEKDIRIFQAESGDDSRKMQMGRRDDLRLVQSGCRGDSRVVQPECGENSKVIQLEGVDDSRLIEPAEQNLSMGQTEENCPSENALSQDTGEGAEVFYQINPECTNGTSYFQCPQSIEDSDGTDEEQAAFVKELENFFKERNMEFKAPKFYGEGLNCLKLWRAVTRLGGYDQVTSCKLWRQVGESFKPPKTCTTVSWSFRGFYEKALLDYERHKLHGGELPMPVNVQPDVLLPVGSESQPFAAQASGSGRARRDAAARAMQGWHSQRLLGNGEVGDPIIKDKNSVSMTKREKQAKNIGMLKRKKTSTLERAVKAARTKGAKFQMDAMVVDVGSQADWVKVNVHKTRDCYEVYALVPGLLREEVRVQCDPAGRLVITGEPEQPDNPWGVTPFKKVVSLPSRIDPHQTSAVVTLHGQLFVRVPFGQSDL